MTEAEGSRSLVRRVGPRRVVTHDADGVLPRQDPTSDDLDQPGDAWGTAAARRGAPPGRPTPEGAPDAVGEPALDARDRWILEQRPPHWG